MRSLRFALSRRLCNSGLHSFYRGRAVDGTGEATAQVRIPAKMTADSGERDRVAQPSLTGVGFLLGPVTFRQVIGDEPAHGFAAQCDAMGAV